MTDGSLVVTISGGWEKRWFYIISHRHAVLQHLDCSHSLYYSSYTLDAITIFLGQWRSCHRVAECDAKNRAMTSSPREILDSCRCSGNGIHCLPLGVCWLSGKCKHSGKVHSAVSDPLCLGLQWGEVLSVLLNASSGRQCPMETPQCGRLRQEQFVGETLFNVFVIKDLG